MAIYEQDVVMFETKENGDKVIKMPISRANNIEGIGRSANTAYVVGDVVYVDNNKKVALKCKQAGTTSSSELNVSTASIGNVITDGTAKWQVCNRTSDVTSVNGKTGDVVVDVGVTSVNNKTGAITLKESPSDMTDYIVESYRNGTEWYEVYKSGKVRQGGKSNNAQSWRPITLSVPMANTDYNVQVTSEGYQKDLRSGVACSNVDRTTTSLSVASIQTNNTYSNQTVDWTVEGQGA